MGGPVVGDHRLTILKPTPKRKEKRIMNSLEVPEPILNAPFAEPAHHWYIREGEEPQKREGRRPSIVYPPRDERKDKHVDWSLTDGTLTVFAPPIPSKEMDSRRALAANSVRWRRKYSRTSNTREPPFPFVRSAGPRFRVHAPRIESLWHLTYGRSSRCPPALPRRGRARRRKK